MFRSEQQLEKIVMALVSGLVCICATFLAFYGKGEGTAVLTAVAGGIYGATAPSGKETTIKRDDPKEDITIK